MKTSDTGRSLYTAGDRAEGGAVDPIYIRVARAIDAGYLTKPEIMTYTGLSLSICTNAITNLWKHGALESSQPRTTKSRGAKYTLRIPVERLVRDFQRPKTLSHDMTVPELERAWPIPVAPVPGVPRFGVPA